VRPMRWLKWSYLVLALVLVLASSVFHAPLVKMRDDWSYRPAVEDFPPSLVLGTQMLGSFRGILVLGLWLRAVELQEQGRYYELVQLFDWITSLEPRLESVWAYAAWNQAYNISVAFPVDKPKDRWRWVMNGISVLRDRGLVINPRSYLLNRELAWIYFHKIGGMGDEAHSFYKEEFAKELHEILGGPTPDYERLAAAPKTEAALLADDAVRSLVEQARAAGFKPLGRDIAWLNDLAKLPEEVAPIFEAAKATPAFAALDAFLRARALEERWRLAPARVKALVDKYGPLDFRVPWAHAIYWATESLRYVKPTDNPDHGRRTIYFGLVEIFETGRLNYFPDETLTFWTPDVRFADAVNEEFLRQIGEGAHGKSAHKHWLRNAIVFLYGYAADKEKAADFYRELQERYPSDDYPAALDDFVVGEIKKDLEENQYQQVMGYILGYVRLACYWLAVGDQELSDQYLATGKLFYALYQEKAPPRYGLVEWETLLAYVIRDVLSMHSGLTRPVRDRLRGMLGLPPEEEEGTPSPAEPE